MSDITKGGKNSFCQWKGMCKLVVRMSMVVIPVQSPKEAAVQQLATLAAAQPRACSWFHEKGRLAAEFLESDASVAAALADGRWPVGVDAFST